MNREKLEGLENLTFEFFNFKICRFRRKNSEARSLHYKLEPIERDIVERFSILRVTFLSGQSRSSFPRKQEVPGKLFAEQFCPPCSIVHSCTIQSQLSKPFAWPFPIYWRWVIASGAGGTVSIHELVAKYNGPANLARLSRRWLSRQIL